MKKIYLVLALALLPFRQQFSQVPVGVVFDTPLAGVNTVNLISEQLHRLLLEDEEGFTALIGDVQEFFDKARSKVNNTVKNMQTIRAIVDIHADILELYNRTIDNINAPRDEDLDGQDDLYFLDKWKHIQILLAITAEAATAFELFESLIEDDVLSIDDKGRVVLIQQVYKDLLRMRSAMRAHIRRINKQIYTYSRAKREIIAFEALFNSN